MAGPGVLKNTLREQELQAETQNSGRSIKPKKDSAGIEPLDRVTRFNRCTCERRPPVPKRSDPVPAPYPPSRDNYIDYNSKHVADITNYHEPKFQIVDSKDGHVMDLEKSGLVPHFTTKPTFGRVPAYLKNSQQHPQQHHGETPREGDLPATERSESIKSRRSTVRQRTVSKEIEVSWILQKRWIELENRLRLISFSRPDKRDAIEDELRSIELKLRMAVSNS